MTQPSSGDGISRGLHQVSRVLAWVAGGVILFGCSIPISIDVVSRFFLNETLVESFEISGYMLAACIGLGMGFTVTTKANIRIDFLTSKLPSPARRVFDLVAALSLALAAGALAWFSLGTLTQSWAMNARSISTLQVPLALPQGVWWFGLFWFSVVATLVPLLAIWRILRGDADGFDKLLAPPGLSDELEQIGADTREAAADRP